MPDLEGLPGAERIAAGLRDLKRRRTTADALLVAIASRRLAELGLAVPPPDRLPRDPELALYALLCQSAEDPYYEYNAALRELDSFVNALESQIAARTRRQERREDAGPSA
jgi:hypothetical protein